METITIINTLASLIITIAVSAFIVFVFGRFSKMDKLPRYEVFIVKMGLCLTASGSLFNCLTLSSPPLSEVFLNCGLAITFLWGAIFHYKYFVKKEK